MKIKNLCQETERLTEEPSIRILRDGTRIAEEILLMKEHQIDVYINDVHTMRLVCTPEHLTELVAGRLLTEGIISSADEIDLLYICEYGNRARVLLKGHEPKEDLASSQDNFVETTGTCCTENHILNSYFLNDRPFPKVEPAVWKTEWIFALADHFALGTEMHKKTVASHSCFLAREGEILFSCEDIGRHNAIDKVAGFALLNGLDRKTCMIYSSGRISTDMAAKTIRSGIPILVSKGQATREAVELAKAQGLTLICGARPDQIKVMSSFE